VANRRPSASRAFAVLLSPCAGETGVIPSFPVSPEEEEEEEVEVVVEVEELDMVIIYELIEMKWGNLGNSQF